MSEQDHGEQDYAAEYDRTRALDAVIGEYLSADEEFLEGCEAVDKIGAVYGMLLEMGEDPDVILREAGVLDEEGDDDEV